MEIQFEALSTSDDAYILRPIHLQCGRGLSKGPRGASRSKVLDCMIRDKARTAPGDAWWQSKSLEVSPDLMNTGKPHIG